MANVKISELNTNSSPSTSATLVGVDNGETVQIPISSLPSGSSSSSSGGGGIIDITDFPSSPSTSVIYRKWQVMKAQVVSNGGIVTDGSIVCEVVNTLPETGSGIVTDGVMYCYYQRADGGAYGYLDDYYASVLNITVGWYPLATLCEIFQYSYKGIIDSLEDAESEGIYVLLTKKSHLYCYHNNGSVLEKSAIITNNNYDFDENLGILTQVIVL